MTEVVPRCRPVDRSPKQIEITNPHSVIPELMFAVVRAYLGEEAAREELSLSRPSSS